MLTETKQNMNFNEFWHLSSITGAQILFMVGRGFLKPDPAKLRPDTPKALRRLLETCLSYSRDNRSNFRNVSSVNYLYIVWNYG